MLIQARHTSSIKSTSDALKYCKDDLQLPEFKDIEGTATFSRNINDAFDILNSRELFSKDTSKVGISKQNISSITKKAEEIVAYVQGLTLRIVDKKKNLKSTDDVKKSITDDVHNEMECDIESLFEDGIDDDDDDDDYNFQDSATNADAADIVTDDSIKFQLVINSKRKTGFVGLIIALRNVINIFNGYYKDHDLFLLTYKLSQDHLEVYFSCVRSRGGHSNNPTANQFVHIFKKLLMHADVKGSNHGNCLLLDNSTILKIPENNLAAVTTGCDEIQYIRCEMSPYIQFDQNGKLIQGKEYYGKRTNLSYLNGVIIYIAGAVLRALCRRSKCDICPVLLTNDREKHSGSDLLERKNRGGLCKPNSDVITICQIAEKIFREFYKSKPGIYKHLIKMCMHSIPEIVLGINHTVDPQSHRSGLIKGI